MMKTMLSSSGLHCDVLVADLADVGIDQMARPLHIVDPLVSCERWQTASSQDH
jgi:hypothetical protein